ERRQPHGPTSEAQAEIGQDGAIDLVQTEFVDTEHPQPVPRGRFVDHAVTTDLGEVANAAQQPVGYSGCTAGPAGDLGGPLRFDSHIEDPRRPQNDRFEIGGGVVVEAGVETETVTQRTGYKTGSGGGPDQGEAGNVHADGTSRRTLAQHDVELEILDGRVEDLLYGSGQPVDLIDEENIAVTELREDRRQITAALQGRTRCDVEFRV